MDIIGSSEQTAASFAYFIFLASNKTTEFKRGLIQPS
jgi:hypothetical protein